MSVVKQLRRTNLQLLCCFVVFFLAGPVAGQTTSGQTANTNKVVIELFYRSDSQQSKTAEQYLGQLKQQQPGLEIKTYDVLEDKQQLKRLWDLSKSHGLEKAGLPTIYMCNRLKVGFRDTASGGRFIEDQLTIKAYIRPGCKHCIAGKAFLDQMVQRWPAVNVKYFDVISDYRARNEVQNLAAQYRVQVASFPCIQAAGRLIVGYQTDEITGQKIENLFKDRSVTFPKVSPPKQDHAEPEKSGTQEEAGKNATEKKSLGGPLTGIAKFAPTSYSVGASLDFVTVAGIRTSPSSKRMALAFATTLGRASRLSTALVIKNLLALPSIQSSGVNSAAARQISVNQEKNTAQDQEDVALPEEFDLPDEVDLPEELDLPGEAQYPNGIGAESVIVGPGLSDGEPDEIVVPLFGRLSASKLGLPTFTFLIGLVDGFNPCAMWVLIFLLSVLVNIKERKKILLVAGTFVVVSGLAYFVFMAAWFNVFQLIGLLRPVQVGLGVVAIIIGLINVKDFFAFHKGITLSIPESAKPGIYRRVRTIVSANHIATALTAAVVLAIVVNIVELLCTAGLPALYTQVLAMQNLPMWANYSYLGLYISAYMLDDAILVAIVVTTLSHRRLQESEGRWLKLLSGVVILALGVVMIFWPDLLV